MAPCGQRVLQFAALVALLRAQAPARAYKGVTHTEQAITFFTSDTTSRARSYAMGCALLLDCPPASLPVHVASPS